MLSFLFIFLWCLSSENDNDLSPVTNFMNKLDDILGQNNIDSGVPCGPVLTMKEIAEDESLRKCGTIVEVDQPGRGKFLTIGCPPKFSSYTPEVKPAPALGEHTDEVLREIGYTADEIAALRKKQVVCKTGKLFVVYKVSFKKSVLEG